MIRNGIIVTLLILCLVFSFASWLSWAKTNDLVLAGKRFTNDQAALYLDHKGYLVLSRNEHLVRYRANLAQRVATQPAMKSNPTIQGALSEGKEYRFAGCVVGFVSSPLPLSTGTRGLLLAIPTLFMSILLGLYPASALVRGPLRRYLRRKKGLCVNCGYNLRGNVSGICPECGEKMAAPLGPQDFERLLRNRRRRIPLRWGSLVLSLLILTAWIEDLIVHWDLTLPMLWPFAVVAIITAFLWWYDLTPINPPVPPQRQDSP